MKVNVGATFVQKMSPIWAAFPNLHRRFHHGTNQGENVMLPASPRRQGVWSVYTHNGTKALIRHLHEASSDTIYLAI